METILKFNDNNIEDDIKFESCIRGQDMSFILWDLDQWLRFEYRRDNGNTKPLENTEISIRDAKIVRSKLRELMEERGLNFVNKIFT